VELGEDRRDIVAVQDWSALERRKRRRDRRVKLAASAYQAVHGMPERFSRALAFVIDGRSHVRRA
jgi:hypothetical protein